MSARTSPKLEPETLESTTAEAATPKPLQLNSGAGLSRSGTLSWQQRPARDGGISRPRPLSSIETIRQIPKDTVQRDLEPDQTEPSRQDIAAALGAKDPAWFRQTQDRGQGSAAFRKNQVEDASVVEHATRSQILPGMSRPASQAANLSPPLRADHRARSQDRETTPVIESRAQRAASPKMETVQDTSRSDLSYPEPKRMETRPAIDMDANKRPGAILSGRSPSPTKGLGGFVESAMMKRSDSVSKRWSVQANAGLKRGDSVAGARPLSSIRAMPPVSLPKKPVRDESPSSPATTSRPGSTHGDRRGLSQSATPEKRAVAGESESQAASIETAPRPKTPTPENELARSPSKTMDSRRWSPTKSSWLESALMSTPDPPKLQPSREEVPAWKVALQRNKASRDLSPEKSKSINPEARDNDSSEATKPVQPPLAGKPHDREEAKPSESELEDMEATRPEPESVDTIKPQQSLSTSSSKSGAPEADKKAPAASARASAMSAVVAETASSEPDSQPTEVKAEKKPATPKPKPQTPPKHDFRSSLRSRAPTSGEGNATEPEFRSVFGKLKRAQTQNYVAPDVLKNNILSGKAALNVTGGPQKTQRIDEFKESILQKKEAMKASAVQKKENPAPETQPTKPEPAVPEALTRRKTLHRATPSVTKLQSAVATPAQTAQEQLKSVPKPTISSKPTLAAPQVSSPPKSFTRSLEPVAQARTADPPITKTRNSEVSAQSIPPAKEPAPATTSPNATTPTKATVGAQKPVVLPKAELPAGSKLASRLNPNLASLLSKGNNPRSSPDGTPSLGESNDPTAMATASQQAIADPSASGELTHMTKGRAKGPKRRAPKSQPAQTASPRQSKLINTTTSAEETDKSTSKSAANPSNVATRGIPASKSPTRPNLSRLGSESRASDPGMNIHNAESKQKVKPAVASKSPELRRDSSSLSTSQIDGTAPKRVNSGRFDIVIDQDATTPIDHHPATSGKPQPPKPDLNLLPLTSSKSRINSFKSAQLPVDPPSKPQSPKPVTGLNPLTKSSVQLQSGPANSQTRLTSGWGSKAPPSIKNESGSDGVEQAKKLLSTYLSTSIDGQRRMEFDASELLSVPHDSNERAKVVSHVIWEIGSGGKKTAMPPQQEHILFEESMYLVVHTFENEAGAKSSEVYLWCGDSIADAAIEDVQIFCKKDARDNNAKLEIIKQGKESARFFQALGGILIVRRSKASSMYMLCGRRHLGHIAFDEVDVAASNLCSGFAYLISAKFGKLYLWKGKGSGADEVGCARLIGMDLGLTGEIEEISEGQEPSSFWESFSLSSRDANLSSDWEQRANHKCYPTSLYRIEIDTPKAAGGFWGLRAASPPKATNKAAIEMISPFNYRDLEPANVYVLDTYRSIFV